MLIDIKIPGSNYGVRVGSPIEELKDYLKDIVPSRRFYIITDTKVGALYGAEIKKILARGGFDAEYKEIPAGEEFKSLETAENIIKDMCEKKIERFTPVIAFGGGVTGDLAGFIASIYMRGLPFINVPTTLMAQVDSSIGGKTGVNLSFGKNLIGTFYQPRYVHCDIELLRTLEKDEYISGLGEVIKHALIKGESFLKFLEDNVDGILKIKQSPVEIMVAECVKIKGEVVASDEKEKGLRRILNLGHTFGHAIEVLAGYGKIKHGEGVSIGMAAAAEISAQMGYASENYAARICALLENYSLPVKIPEGIDIDKLIEFMYMDKKVRDGRIEFVLPAAPGRVEPGIEVGEEMLLKTAEKLR